MKKKTNDLRVLLWAVVLALMPGLGLQAQLGTAIDGMAAGDNFGLSMSLSSDGSRLAIGSPGHNSSTGYAQVYEWDGTAWSQMGPDINGDATGDNFGYSVSLSSDGEYLAIGGFAHNSGTGHVRTYYWSANWFGPGMGNWVQRGGDIDGEAAGDLSGWSLSLSSDGDYLAVGAIYNDGTANNAGHVRVYKWNGGFVRWDQLGADIDGEAGGNLSGQSVSLSADGTRLAIGAASNDDNANNAGHVRVYEWNGTAWSQLGLDIDGDAAGDGLGTKVLLSSDGTRLAVSAFGYNNNTGQAKVFEWNGTAWDQLGANINGAAEGDEFSSISFSSDGTRLVIGAAGYDNETGQAQVYEWNGTAWSQLGVDISGQLEADIYGETAGDRFGEQVALSPDGMSMAVAATNYNSGTGRVRVFDGFLPLPAEPEQPTEQQPVKDLPALPASQLLLLLLIIPVVGIGLFLRQHKLA